MAPLTRLILYVRDPDLSVAFYCRHFGYERQSDPEDRLTELVPPPGGSARLLLHKAAKSQKLGQTAVKLVFDVCDVAAFCETAGQNGLTFGSLHKADGYVFANAKDPDGNSIQVSSRAFK